jgi:hypothetical protein
MSVGDIECLRCGAVLPLDQATVLHECPPGWIAAHKTSLEVLKEECRTLNHRIVERNATIERLEKDMAKWVAIVRVAIDHGVNCECVRVCAWAKAKDQGEALLADARLAVAVALRKARP